MLHKEGNDRLLELIATCLKPPRMKLHLLLACVILVLINPLYTRVRAADDAQPQLNQLTPAETADGWRLLFDGKTTAGWRNFKTKTFPDKGWVVEEAVL